MIGELIGSVSGPPTVADNLTLSQTNRMILPLMMIRATIYHSHKKLIKHLTFILTFYRCLLSSILVF